jgi:hypothetical protein
MDASLGVGIALHADSTTRTLAGACVGLGALTAHRQTAQVADATVTLDRLHALEVKTDLTTKIALDHILALLDRVNDLGELGFGQILGANARINAGNGEDVLRVGRADAVNVAERDVDALVRWNLNTNNACHKMLALTLFVASIGADDTNDAFATHHFAVLTKFFN